MNALQLWVSLITLGAIGLLVFWRGLAWLRVASLASLLLGLGWLMSEVSRSGALEGSGNWLGVMALVYMALGYVLAVATVVMMARTSAGRP